MFYLDKSYDKRQKQSQLADSASQLLGIKGGVCLLPTVAGALALGGVFTSSSAEATQIDCASLGAGGHTESITASQFNETNGCTVDSTSYIEIKSGGELVNRLPGSATSDVLFTNNGRIDVELGGSFVNQEFFSSYSALFINNGGFYSRGSVLLDDEDAFINNGNFITYPGSYTKLLGNVQNYSNWAWEGDVKLAGAWENEATGTAVAYNSSIELIDDDIVNKGLFYNNGDIYVNGDGSGADIFNRAGGTFVNRAGATIRTESGNLNDSGTYIRNEDAFYFEVGSRTGVNTNLGNTHEFGIWDLDGYYDDKPFGVLIDESGGWLIGDTITLVDAQGGSIDADASNLSVYGEATFSLTLSPFDPNIGTWELSGGGLNDLVLTLTPTSTVVPEPSTYALLAGSLLACRTARRRRACA